MTVSLQYKLSGRLPPSVFLCKFDLPLKFLCLASVAEVKDSVQSICVIMCVCQGSVHGCMDGRTDGRTISVFLNFVEMGGGISTVHEIENHHTVCCLKILLSSIRKLVK